MVKPNLSDIAEHSGKSVSTVSKVLRSCPGVTEETRDAVMRSVHILSGHEVRESESKCDISVILPDRPGYFWQKARGKLQVPSARVGLKIYSRIAREGCANTVERYVTEAEEEGARAVILAARADTRLMKILSRIAKNRLLIQLCEYADVPNTFFVGSDGYADGWRLAEKICPRCDRIPRIGIPLGDGSYLTERRIRGFTDALRGKAEIFQVENPDSGTLYSARLARSIDALGVPLDYLFCFDGVTADACEALYKLRGKMNTRLIGFEYPKTAEKYMADGRIVALAVQDPAAQMSAALDLADRYLTTRTCPNRKFTYLPSEIVMKI